jgi:RNA polymerase sigma-70 factor (ECF subfamily)
MAGLAENAQTTAAPVAAFPTTDWGVILAVAQRGSPEAEGALAKLCAAYWYPLYAFIRQSGYGQHEAEDLTQEFFARLVEKHYLEGITIEGGRFRSYLLTALKHFLANERDKLRSEKRGGGRSIIPIDEVVAEELYRRELVDDETPDLLFERRWAVRLLEHVRRRLAQEYQTRGREELFRALEGHLSGAARLIPYAALGARLGMSEGAVKVAVHRLRKRFGQLLRLQIAETVSRPEEIDEEIRYLITVAGG